MTTALIVIGTAISAIEGIRAARTNNAQLRANAAASDLNARIAGENAALDQRRKERELADSRRKYNLLFGKTLAQSSALGMFGGSTLDVLSDLSVQNILERQSIVDERDSSAQGNLNQQAAYKNKSAALRSGIQSGMSIALGAIGTVALGLSKSGVSLGSMGSSSGAAGAVQASGGTGPGEFASIGVA